MKKPGWIYQLFLSVCLIYGMHAAAQTSDTIQVPYLIQQQLENSTAGNYDVSPQDDSWLQQMEQYLKAPIDLNKAEESELNHLRVLTSLQIHSFIIYRQLLGKFISIYELQAIPGWNVQLIEMIRPYITVSAIPAGKVTLPLLLKKGSASLVVKEARVLQPSKGYIPDTSGNYYHGSPDLVYLRFKYSFKDIFQYGITLQKQAGEPFLKAAQQTGFDFNSVHLFLRNRGAVKSLAIGDFAVNMGQGLIQWQHGLAYKKGSQVLNIKRQEDVLVPYNSTGQFNFHRGVGITMRNHLFEFTGFGSYRKMDATVKLDTLTDTEYISALQNSGYHRTKREMANMGSQVQVAFGGNVSYTHHFFHLGFNAIQYYFKTPMDKGTSLYNKYAFSGKDWLNCSLDYGYTWQNMHVFGELATDKNKNLASVTGLMVSLGKRADMSFLYRNISEKYQSFYNNAFTESSAPTNEKGFYAGLSLLPLEDLKITAYADMYSFPWLKYRVNRPSDGKDYLIQVNYTPRKQTELYSTFHYEQKAINYNPALITLDPVVPQTRRDWRTHLSFPINSKLILRARFEILWLVKGDTASERGFLSYFDLIYKANRKLWINGRFQYFETDGYDSRIYSFEDMGGAGIAVPVFYGKGTRMFINVRYALGRKIFLSIRYGTVTYPGVLSIGTGLDQIPGNRKSEVSLQLSISF